MEAAAAPGSDDAVAERIAGHCQFFDKMFELIPAKFYFNTDAAAARSALESKFSHNKKRKAPKQAVKEATTKAKKAKLNPDAHKSNRERLLQGAFAHEDALVDAADDSGKEGSGMDDLKQRLLIRVQELRKQRQATAHRKLNGDAAVKKQKTAPDKKQKRKKKPAAKAAAAGDDASDGAAGSAGAVEPGASGGKPNTNTNDFMFAAKIGQEDPRIKARRKKTDAALLKKAQHFDRTLQQADEDQRTELKESKEWEAALSRAEGSKVKDDVALLKKSIKRKEKSKEKSRKAWQKRLSDHDRRAKEQQEREDKKKQWRIENKGKKKKKGGSSAGNRPGFEGRTIVSMKG